MPGRAMRPSGEGPAPLRFMRYRGGGALLASSFKYTAGGGTEARPPGTSYSSYIHLHTLTYILCRAMICVLCHAMVCVHFPGPPRLSFHPSSSNYSLVRAKGAGTTGPPTTTFLVNTIGPVLALQSAMGPMCSNWHFAWHPPGP